MLGNEWGLSGANSASLGSSVAKGMTPAADKSSDAARKLFDAPLHYLDATPQLALIYANLTSAGPLI